MCSLLCRGWRNVSQHHLFRSLVLRQTDNRFSIKALLPLLNGINSLNVNLLEAVQDVAVHGRQGAIPHGRDSDVGVELSADDVVHLLDKLPSVHTLRFYDLRILNTRPTMSLSVPRAMRHLLFARFEFRVPVLDSDSNSNSSLHIPCAASDLLGMFASVHSIKLIRVFLTRIPSSTASLVSENLPTPLRIGAFVSDELSFVPKREPPSARKNFLKHLCRALPLEVTQVMDLQDARYQVDILTRGYGRAITQLHLRLSGIYPRDKESYSITKHCKSLASLYVDIELRHPDLAFSIPCDLTFASPPTLTDLTIQWTCKHGAHYSDPREFGLGSTTKELFEQDWAKLDAHFCGGTREGLRKVEVHVLGWPDKKSAFVPLSEEKRPYFAQMTSRLPKSQAKGLVVWKI
ncbi:hypothetical protein EIP91_007240 [Steccherinum ochraceum]|uniref:Uncharacterized protein n=1 Tax=Steccherinum ochraceum TaxID=92696 RepID=A0A4R0R4I7_9APHY|nr:hypothetical protein EIP91_007240 [Steccherinum ochraceum]